MSMNEYLSQLYFLPVNVKLTKNGIFHKYSTQNIKIQELNF